MDDGFIGNEVASVALSGIGSPAERFEVRVQKDSRSASVLKTGEVIIEFSDEGLEMSERKD